MISRTQKRLILGRITDILSQNESFVALCPEKGTLFAECSYTAIGTKSTNSKHMPVSIDQTVRTCNSWPREGAEVPGRILDIPEIWPAGKPQDPEKLTLALGVLGAQQLATWPEYAARGGGLDKLQYEQVAVGGAHVLVQFNPGRSQRPNSHTNMKITPENCFLSPGNQPEEERAIIVDDVLISVNPFPLSPEQFVVSSRTHEPQTLRSQLTAMLRLAKAIRGNGTLGYNGAVNGGASNPEHAHMHIVPDLPIEAGLAKSGLGKALLSRNGVDIYMPRGLIASQIVVRGSEPKAVQNTMLRLADRLRVTDEREARMNVTARYNGKSTVFQAILTPRNEASTEVECMTSGEGDKPEPVTFPLNPAFAEMSGLIILPFEKGDIRVTERVVRQIFKTTTLGYDETRATLGNLRSLAA